VRYRLRHDFRSCGHQRIDRIYRLLDLCHHAPRHAASKQCKHLPAQPLDQHRTDIGTVGMRDTARRSRQRDRAVAPDHARRRVEAGGAIGEPHALFRSAGSVERRIADHRA
jgi:hypothetical protein